MNEYNNNLNYTNNTDEITIQKLDSTINGLGLNFYFVDGMAYETKNEILKFYKKRENFLLDTKFTIKKQNNKDWLKKSEDGILKWTPMKVNRTTFSWDSIDLVVANLKEIYPNDRIIFHEKRKIKTLWIISIIFISLIALILLIILLTI